MIRYVCISDLHAGAPASLFSSRAGLPDLATDLAHAIRKLIGHDKPFPQLVLLGDTLDLQFSKRATAMHDGIKILSRLFESSCFDAGVLATAGNHDHAIWSEARLALDLAGALSLRPQDTPRATPAFTPDPEARSHVLETVLTKSGAKSVDLRYPNIGLGDNKRAVLMHHGHFHESIYRVITGLRDAFAAELDRPITAASLAAQNAGWIDFAWATLGDADGTGAISEQLYQTMLTPMGFRHFVDEATPRLLNLARAHLPVAALSEVQATLDTVIRTGLDMTLGRMRETERFHEVDPLSPAGREGLEWYLGGPGLHQIRTELSDTPEALTYISGHTHKPYVDRVSVEACKRPIEIINTGGWTLNGPRHDNAEGASLALIDDGMNVLSLNILGTPHNGQMRAITVTGFANNRPDAQAFRDYVIARLQASRTDWATFQTTAHRHYDAIQANLLGRTK